MATEQTFSLPKGSKDAFANFFEDPSKDALRSLLKENLGETRLLDFKEMWPKGATLAKHVLGIANSGPGCIVVGVKELDDGSLDPSGLESISDKIKIRQSMESYLPSTLLGRVHIQDFAFESSEYAKLKGRKFQVLFVEHSPEHIPFMALKNGEGLRESAIYVRREAGTVEASYSELQNLLNERIATEYSTKEEVDLKQHLEQLRVLYGEIPRYSSIFGLGGASFMGGFDKPNPNAPDETFEEFVSNMIAAKKMVIAKATGVSQKDYLATVEAQEVLRRLDRPQAARPVRGKSAT